PSRGSAHRLTPAFPTRRSSDLRSLDIAIPTEVSDLTRAVHQFGWARWIVDEEERRSCLLIVAGPYAFPASVDGIVDRAVGRQGPVAEDVQHQRLALACSVFQACTHALASTEVSYLAGCTLARVVVEAAHADRTCARIALNDELHHGRRFLEFAVSAEVRPEDRGDVRILGRIERTGIAERIDRIGCLHVAAQE